MPPDDRPRALAGTASALAAGTGVTLPDSLALWALGGGRPRAPAQVSSTPGEDLGAALGAALTEQERRRGAHFTPAAVAVQVAALALAAPGDRPIVVDPTCGGGALLLAAGDRLTAAGVPAEVVARDLLWGADLDPLAAAVTEAAIALWSGGTAPAPGHVVVADTLALGMETWPAAPSDGFDALVGNPPFQGQLGRGTVRDRATQTALRARYGPAVAAYADTAALFLLAGSQLVAPGGRLAMVMPQSVVAARDAHPVREALAATATLVELWVPDGSPFAARVNVCVPVFEVGAGDGRADWSSRLAAARGVPAVELRPAALMGDRATAVASFREEYYGLVPHVHEAGSGGASAPLVTSGLIDVGRSSWGSRSVRFGKTTWGRPEVDVSGVHAAGGRVSAWLERVQRPKVVVASQTRVVEAASDRGGTWVPSTPTVAVVPHDPEDVDRLTAALCAPPVSAWMVRRAAGTALSADAMRISASLLSDVPLPGDAGAWAEATALLAAGDLAGFAMVATRMYGPPADDATAVESWWRSRCPTR